MPKSELHKRKRAKNIAVFIAVILFVAVIYAVTLVRLKGG